MLFNGVLALVQEGRAKATLATLKQRLAPTALVRRDGMWGKHPAADLVPGDAIRLPLGSLVPADVRLVSGAILVDQSLLTGESVPTGAGPGDVAYAGAQVRRGQAIAEVAATGSPTGTATAGAVAASVAIMNGAAAIATRATRTDLPFQGARSSPRRPGSSP